MPPDPPGHASSAGAEEPLPPGTARPAAQAMPLRDDDPPLPGGGHHHPEFTSGQLTSVTDEQH